MVIGGRLAPALVSPVATAIRKHAGEVALLAAIDDARTRKWRAGVGVGPCVAAVGGPVNLVGVVVREASTAFVHRGDVHVTRDLVPGDLDVAEEASAELSLVSPGRSVVGGDRCAGDVDGAGVAAS